MVDRDSIIDWLESPEGQDWAGGGESYSRPLFELIEPHEELDISRWPIPFIIHDLDADRLSSSAIYEAHREFHKQIGAIYEASEEG